MPSLDNARSFSFGILLRDGASRAEMHKKAIKQLASRGSHLLAYLEPTTICRYKFAKYLMVLRLFADVLDLRQLHARSLLLGFDFDKAGQ